jgi:RimJ/RimL family protein N-acetyltransferase
MMVFRLATTEWDAEVVRIIRNSGRQWMTRDTREISYDAQQAWWKARDPDSCWVYIGRIAETDVGYGMLRLLDDDRWWASLAVLPRYQGNGYGSEIYRHLALSTSQDVWAEILADNTPSIRACLKAGYQIAYAMDKHAVLVHKK